MLRLKRTRKGRLKASPTYRSLKAEPTYGSETLSCELLA